MHLILGKALFVNSTADTLYLIIINFADGLRENIYIRGQLVAIRQVIGDTFLCEINAVPIAGSELILPVHNINAMIIYLAQFGHHLLQGPVINHIAAAKGGNLQFGTRVQAFQHFGVHCLVFVGIGKAVTHSIHILQQVIGVVRQIATIKAQCITATQVAAIGNLFSEVIRLHVNVISNRNHVISFLSFFDV